MSEMKDYMPYFITDRVVVLVQSTYRDDVKQWLSDNAIDASRIDLLFSEDLWHIHDENHLLFFKLRWE